MRSPAQIDEAVAVAVEGHRSVAAHLGVVDLLDDLAFVRMVGEELQPFGCRGLTPFEGLVGLDDLAHPGVDAFQVVVGERGAVGQVEVVVEAVLDGGSDGEVGARPQVEHGLGQHVGRGVPQGLDAQIVAVGDQLDHGAVGERPVEVDLFLVDDGDQRCSGQAGPDLGRQVTRSGARGERALGSVGQRHGDVGHRSTSVPVRGHGPGGNSPGWTGPSDRQFERTHDEHRGGRVLGRDLGLEHAARSAAARRRRSSPPRLRPAWPPARPSWWRSCRCRPDRRGRESRT